METIRIEILNPKAKLLLKNLADLKLIKIKAKSEIKDDFIQLLQKLRRNSDVAPSLEEITAEVEKIRESRYEKKEN